MKTIRHLFLLLAILTTSCLPSLPTTKHSFSAIFTIKQLALDLDFYECVSNTGPDYWTIIRHVNSPILKSAEGKYLGEVYFSEGSSSNEAYIVMTVGEQKRPSEMFVLRVSHNGVEQLERRRFKTNNFGYHNGRIIASFMTNHLDKCSLPSAKLRTDKGLDLIPPTFDELKDGDPYVICIDGHYLHVIIDNYRTNRGYWFTGGKQTDYAFGAYSDLTKDISKPLESTGWILDKY